MRYRHIALISGFFIIIFLFTACGHKTIDLSYIKTPEKITLKSLIYIKEMNELAEQLKNTRNDVLRNKIKIKLEEYTQKTTLEIDDEAFINMIFDSIRKTWGEISNDKGLDIINADNYILESIYDKETTLEMIEEGYIPTLFILGSGTVLLPTYDEDSKNTLLDLITKISPDLITYIDKYFKEHKNSLEN